MEPAPVLVDRVDRLSYRAWQMVDRLVRGVVALTVAAALVVSCSRAPPGELGRAADGALASARSGWFGLAGDAARSSLAPWRGIIKIAVVAPYSGSVTSPGLSLLAGARAAADDLNRAGGVAGYRLLIEAPDERNASTPRDVVADPAVVAVVGHLVWTDEPVYREAGLAWLATEPVGSGQTVFRLTPPADDLRRVLVRDLRQQAEWSEEDATRLAGWCLSEADSSAIIQEPGVAIVCRGTAENVVGIFQEPAGGAHLVCVPVWCLAPELAQWSDGRSYDYFDLSDFRPGAVIEGASPSRLASRTTSPALAALGYEAVDRVARAAAVAALRGTVDRLSIAAALRQARQGEDDQSLVKQVDVIVRRSDGLYPGEIILQARGPLS